MLSFKNLFTLSFCLFLAACGFHPLYNHTTKNYNICYPIKIATIPDRDGQILRNYLLDMLTPEGAPEKPLYTLEIKITEVEKNIGVKKDETTLRKEIDLKACIVLRDCHRKIVYKHSVKAINSFQILSQNYYSDLIARDYSKREALKLLAEKITLVIGAYLSKPAHQ